MGFFVCGIINIFYITILRRFFWEKFFIILLIMNSIEKYNFKQLIVYLAIFFFVLLLPQYYDYLSNVYHFCIFKAIFAIDCPGCGVIRGTIALLNFNFIDALNYNPLSFAFIIFLFFEIITKALAATKKLKSKNAILFSKINNNLFIFFVFFLWTIKFFY